jgi:hypothetical protein
MEAFYGMPFERFERSSPFGTPQDVAEALAPYVAAGARSLLITPITPQGVDGLEAVAEVRDRLRGGR